MLFLVKWNSGFLPPPYRWKKILWCFCSCTFNLSNWSIFNNYFEVRIIYIKIWPNSTCHFFLFIFWASQWGSCILETNWNECIHCIKYEMTQCNVDCSQCHNWLYIRILALTLEYGSFYLWNWLLRSVLRKILSLGHRKEKSSPEGRRRPRRCKSCTPRTGISRSFCISICCSTRAQYYHYLSTFSIQKKTLPTFCW